MAFDAEAARLLATDDDRLAFHQGADVLEAHGGFVDLHPKQPGDRIHLMTGRNGPHDRARPTTVLPQMIEGESENLIGSQPCAVFIHDTKSVGVAIQAKAQMRLPAADKLTDFGHAFRIWLGMMSTKQ